MSLIVQLSDHFKRLYANFPRQDQQLIAEFIVHCQMHGLVNLEGKLARTSNVPGVDPDYHAKRQFAIDNYLWHYHIGIPYYQAARNQFISYKTSDWVVHFQRFPGNKEIRLVDYGFHDPMHMPKPEYFVFTKS